MAGIANCANGIGVTAIRSGILCEECGLKFDSFTSLEVHVAYHKENLLDKWRQQGHFTSDLNNHSESHKLSAPAPIAVTETGVPSHQNRPEKLDSGTGTFLAMNGNGHNVIYLPSYYRSNVQFHNPSVAQPYSGEIHGFYNGNPAHESPAPSLQIPHPNLCLSAADIAPMEMDHHSRLEKLGTDAGAEILDLDSNTVHVVNNNSGQPGHSDRGQFYRPFLNGTSTSTPPAPHWAPAVDQEAGMMRTYAVQPREPMPSIVYTQAQMHSGPALSSAMLQDSARGPFAQDVKQEPSQSSDRGILASQLVVEQSPANTDKELAGTPPAFGTPDPAPPNSKSVSSSGKVKGWKGGECKRPKTYNCTACNKWFTSSGHLKRHYGTTLHKNSIRQLGEDGVREPNSAPQKGPTAKGKRNSTKKNGAANSENDLKDRSNSAPAGGSANGGKEHIYAGRDNGLANGDTPQGSHDVRSNDTATSRSPDMQTSSSSSSTAADEKFQVGKLGDNSLPVSRSPYEDVAQLPYNYSYPPNPPASFSPSVGHAAPPPVLDNTAIYNSGYNVAPIQLNGGLPPFSSVGYSHYDPHLFPHLNPNMGQHYPSLGPNRTGLNSSAYYSSPGMVTSPFSNPQGQQTHAPRPGTNSGSPEPEVARSTDFDFRNFDEESPSNSPSREFVSSGGESLAEESPTEQVTVFRCPECPKTFGRGCYLTQHMNSSHAGLPFKCTTCGKKFSEADALTEHVRKHGDDKPFRCEHDQCLKQFNHKTDLRRHLCLHTGEKPFICKTCGKGFIRKDHMNKHTETHRKKLKEQGRQGLR